ncbi:MAG: hypothetical protein GKR94_15685 [Gammaproteobacteria bacterium]|nr:hypothetical protein [Gammaproteobacteria bacterium]
MMRIRINIILLLAFAYGAYGVLENADNLYTPTHWNTTSIAPRHGCCSLARSRHGIVVSSGDVRIVPQNLWEAAKARQDDLDKRTGHLGSRKRPQYLLSGLLVCGSCGSGFSKINSERYGCSSA